MVKNLPADAGDKKTQVQSMSWEDPLEEGMATPAGILAWRSPCVGDPGGLQSIGSQRKNLARMNTR